MRDAQLVIQCEQHPERLDCARDMNGLATAVDQRFFEFRDHSILPRRPNITDRQKCSTLRGYRTIAIRVRVDRSCVDDVAGLQALQPLAGRAEIHGTKAEWRAARETRWRSAILCFWTEEAALRRASSTAFAIARSI